MPKNASRPQFAARKSSTSRQRAVDTREIRQRFLIVCEGTKTEPNYFDGFRAPSHVLKIVGTGRSTLGLVDEAIRCKVAAQKRASYDQCWCVFDKDSFSASAFNDAIAKAINSGFQVAYSNEAFELWYLLHYDYCDAATSRTGYKARLTVAIGRPYMKNSETMYRDLLERQPIAIKNAEKLLAAYATNSPQLNNPSTTVHLLVKELNKNIL